MGEPGFWDKPEDAQKTIAALKSARRVVTGFDGPAKGHADLRELFDLARAENDAATLDAVAHELDGLEPRVHDLELESLLAGDNDHLGAVVTITPGAGGTESQDWAQMLFRMYTRLCERKGWSYAVLDLQAGDEAGIKSATIEVNVEYAYGFLRSESGVHRLVRISPFDAAKRRHTSFSSVFVFPQIDDTITVDLKDDDLRVDTFRASGAGGQHVNKTESAVRITHIPTGIVVQSQNDRSQHRNRAECFAMLKSRLYELELRKRMAEADKLASTKTDIEWGHQIRSYVLDQSRIKDLRTGVEKGDTQRVLDGDLDDFIAASLKQGV
jgi:peptide chain release factor 2